MHVHVGSRLDAVRPGLTSGTCHTHLCNHVCYNSVSQNSFGLGYKANYDHRLAVQAVITDFAKRFSLPVAVCKAWHLQIRLNGTETLLQV